MSKSIAQRSGLAPAGQQHQQDEKGEQRVGDGLDHVAEHGQRLLGDLAGVQPGRVLLRHGLRPPDGQHHGRRVVHLLTDDVACVVDRIQHGVLADQVGRCRCRGRDAVLQVGLLDLPGDGGIGGRSRQRRIQLEGELALDAGQLRGKPAVEVRVGVRAGVDGDRAASACQGREAGRVGRCHQRPHVVRTRERARIDRAVDQVVHRAVVDEVDQVRAEVRILERDAACLPDEAVAEHQSVLLVAQFARQGADARNDLEGRLEQARERVPDRTGDAAEKGHAERDVGHHLDGGSAGLVDDAHGHPRHDEDGEHQQHGGQPLPALQLLGREGVGHQRRDEPAEGHGGDRRHVVARAVDGCRSVEDAEQAVGVLVGVDLPHASLQGERGS
jgi:hypothetical protein